MVAGRPCTDPTHERRLVSDKSGSQRTRCMTCYKKTQKEWREANKDSVKERQSNWYHDNKEHVSNKSAAYRKSNGDSIRQQKKNWYENNKEHASNKSAARYAQNREQLCEDQAEKRRSSRTAVLNHYGKFCACCGIDKLELLTVDHVVPIGSKNRPSGSAVYANLVRDGFPGNIQILCHGCNSAKGTRLKCPHWFTPKVSSPSAKSLLKLKTEAMAAYGPDGCFCCGESNVYLLQLDHVNGDGSKHRKQLEEQGMQVGGGSWLYRHLRKNGWPNNPPLRVACGTCNYGSTLPGGCPCGGVEDRNRRVALGLVPAVG